MVPSPDETGASQRAPAPGSAPLIRFGPFEVDLHSAELRCEGLRSRLPEQSFRVLELLLENAGELVTRDVLREKLWSSPRFVDFDAGLNSAVKRLRDALHDSADNPRYIETLPRRGYRFLCPVVRIARATQRPARIESIAVLPLENLTGDPGQDYLVDGLTDALITCLVQVGEVRVISRTSVMRYKNARGSLRDIARMLQADAIVEGTVSRSSTHVRVTAQLIHAATDRHLWASQYERELTDPLLLQDEVARAIVQEVSAKLAGGRTALGE